MGEKIIGEEKDRIKEIESMPPQMHDDALVRWKTVNKLVDGDDVEYTRRTLLAAGLPVVELSERKKLPRWGTLREFLRKRERAT